MAYEIIYKPLDLSNVEPTLVRESGGILQAAVARKELNFEVAKLDEQIDSKASIADIRKNYMRLDLFEFEESVTRSVSTESINGVEYTNTVFTLKCWGWEDTTDIWRSAFLKGNEQVDLLGRFSVVEPGVVQVAFQSDEPVPSGMYKMILQRIPAVPEPAPAPNNPQLN